MHPYLVHSGEFALPTYGLMAALGLIAGLSVVVRYARWEGIDPDRAWNLGIIAILSAIVGAKLLFVMTSWRFYRTNPGALFSVATLQIGGIWYGGLIAAIGMCLWYVIRNHLPVRRTADIYAPAIAIGHAIGRVGCLAAGCCYGRPTNLPWGIKFTSPLANQLVGTPLGVYLHPTQVYEGLVELGNFLFLTWLLRHKQFDGQVAGAYLFLYGVARYFIEFFRGDRGSGAIFGVMTLTQLISIFLVVGGAALWVRWRSTEAAPATV